jgi:methyl-accepting chemotaxis protein
MDPKLVLAPMKSLSNRLTMPRKIGVVALVLIVPLLLVIQAYVHTLGGNVGVAAAERSGVRYGQPVITLLGDVVRDRDAVVTGSAPTLDLRGDIATVDRADRRDGKALKVSAQWAKLRTTLTALPSTGGPASARAYDAAAQGVMDLLTQVGNTSNLILDPDLDSYYVMDAWMLRLPAIVDTASQATMLVRQGGSAQSLVPQLAVDAGAIATNLAALPTDAQTAAKGTSDPRLRAAFNDLDAVQRTGNAFVTQLQANVSGKHVVPDPSALENASAKLSATTGKELDRLLVRRIGRLKAGEHRAFTEVGIALLAALWFFLGCLSALRRQVDELHGTLAAMATGDLSRRPAVDSKDEFGRMAVAVSSAAEQLGGTIRAVTDSTDVVAAATVELAVAADGIAAAVADTTDQATAVERAAEEVGSRIAAMSAGTEQLQASISEIAASAAQAAQAAGSAVDAVGRTDDRVARLGTSSAEIEHVARLISSVADQTNLLALNATIEAARAGEAGRGFAVVATAVKELAAETARATDEIGQRIAAIRDDTAGAVEAMRQVTGVIDQVNGYQSAIASAVEEQDSTTAGAARDIDATARATNEIVGGVSAVADSARQTMVGVEQARRVARELTDTVSDLRVKLDGFRC